jgi:hypothetical protein
MVVIMWLQKVLDKPPALLFNVATVNQEGQMNRIKYGGSGFPKCMRNPELSSMETPNGRATFEKVSPTKSLVWKEGKNLGSVEKVGRHWITGDGRRFDSKKFAASALLWDAGLMR